MFKLIANFITKDGDFSPLRLSMIAFFLFGGLSFFFGRNLNPNDYMYQLLVDVHDTFRFLFNLSFAALFVSAAYEIYKSKS